MYRRTLAVFMILAMVVVFSGIASAAETQTLTGTLVSKDQLKADDGQVYTLENTEAAQNLDQLMDKKVEIKGAVMEKEGKKVIQVESIEPAK
jgi:hypothetical protein